MTAITDTIQRNYHAKRRNEAAVAYQAESRRVDGCLSVALLIVFVGAVLIGAAVALAIL